MDAFHAKYDINDCIANVESVYKRMVARSVLRIKLYKQCIDRFHALLYVV